MSELYLIIALGGEGNIISHPHGKFIIGPEGGTVLGISWIETQAKEVSNILNKYFGSEVEIIVQNTDYNKWISNLRDYDFLLTGEYISPSHFHKNLMNGEYLFEVFYPCGMLGGFNKLSSPITFGELKITLFTNENNKRLRTD